MEERLKGSLIDMERHVSSVHAKANSNREAISALFNDLRRSLQERENELKQSIAGMIEKEEAHYEGKENQCRGHLSRIEEFKREMMNMEGEGEIEVLQKTSFRYDLA